MKVYLESPKCFVIDFEDKWSKLAIWAYDDRITCGYVSSGRCKANQKSNWLALLVVTGITKQEVLDVKRVSANATQAARYFEGRIDKEELKLDCGRDHGDDW
jgi:hypothetical protein